MFYNLWNQIFLHNSPFKIYLTSYRLFHGSPQIMVTIRLINCVPDLDSRYLLGLTCRSFMAVDIFTCISWTVSLIAKSINIHVPFSLSRIIMSGLLLGIVLSVCTCWFHNMVTLPPWLVSTDFGTCVFCPIVPLFPCICWSVVVHTLYHVLFLYSSFASIGHADIMWCIVSSNCWQSQYLPSVSVFNSLLLLLLLLRHCILPENKKNSRYWCWCCVTFVSLCATLYMVVRKASIQLKNKGKHICIV